MVPKPRRPETFSSPFKSLSSKDITHTLLLTCQGCEHCILFSSSDNSPFYNYIFLAYFFLCGSQLRWRVSDRSSDSTSLTQGALSSWTRLLPFLLFYLHSTLLCFLVLITLGLHLWFFVLNACDSPATPSPRPWPPTRLPSPSTPSPMNTGTLSILFTLATPTESTALAHSRNSTDNY